MLIVTSGQVMWRYRIDIFPSVVPSVLPSRLQVLWCVHFLPTMSLVALTLLNKVTMSDTYVKTDIDFATCTQIHYKGSTQNFKTANLSSSGLWCSSQEVKPMKEEQEITLWKASLWGCRLWRCKHPSIRRWTTGTGRNAMFKWDGSKKDLRGLQTGNLLEKQGTK